MLGKMLIFNLISNNTVCNTNTTTNANEIKALTRIESEKIYVFTFHYFLYTVFYVFGTDYSSVSVYLYL